MAALAPTADPASLPPPAQTPVRTPTLFLFPVRPQRRHECVTSAINPNFVSRPILGGNQNCTPSQAEFQLGAYSRLAFYLCAGFSNCCSVVVAFSLVANSDFDLHSSLAVVALICCCCLRLLHELKVPLYTLSESEFCVFPKLRIHMELVIRYSIPNKHDYHIIG